ncbi:MAG: PD-(D/E)XK nuclease family protein [Rickettsiaceae bacterium]|nr:PD-(D/E)XK nuclease family protein [Rickettsiaceae bacterium]
MKIVYTNPRENYLYSASKIIVDLLESEQSFSNIKVILPNFFEAELFKDFLQNACREIYGTNSLIAPNITTSSQYISDIIIGDSAIKARLEQILIMARIIKDCDQINYRIIDAISIAKEIVGLYWKLKKNLTNLGEIDEWAQEDLAEHWWLTSHFLKFCFTNFEQQISGKNILLESSKPKSVITVGITEDIKLIREYTSKNQIDHLSIFPPLVLEKNKQMREQCCIRYLQKFYPPDAIEDNNTNASREDSKEIILHEFYDVFDEADFLYKKIISITNSTISIVTNNSFLENLLTIKLKSSQIPYYSSFGFKYLEFDESALFLAIARLKSERGSIESLTTLITSKLIYKNHHIQKFLEELNDAGRFYENIEEILLDNKSFTQNELLKILNEWLLFEGQELKAILAKNYDIFKKIYKTLGLTSKIKDAEKFKYFIESVLALKCNNFDVSLEEYLIYISRILSIKNTMPYERGAEVYILKHEDSLLIDTDLVMFADFNQESIITNPVEEEWLSSKILKKLLVISQSESFDKIAYYIQNKLNKFLVIFSRAKYSKGTEQEICTVLNDYDHKIIRYPKQTCAYQANLAAYSSIDEESSLQQNNLDSNPRFHNKEFNANTEKQLSVDLSQMPKILYATNIEMLLRSPYGFFARKILELKPKKNILSQISNADFGSVIHKIIEENTKTDFSEQLIIDDTLTKRGIYNFYKLLWNDAIKSILAEINIFDIKIKELGGVIFSEIEGAFVITLDKKDIEIRAIADRIEVLPDKIRIVDFKTGAPPTKKDLLCGKSPQLMIEAMIYKHNGFKDIIFDQAKKVELVFIKINTREPYTEENIISINIEDIYSHEVHLRKFLDYYYSYEQQFSPNPLPEFWQTKFDEYEHFRHNIF